MPDGLRHAWRAAWFVADLVAGDGDTWVARRGGAAVVTTLQVPSGTRRVACDRYVVPGPHGRPRPAIVVTHGFTHQGQEDPRLQGLCRRLARAGFVVVAPAFDEMRHYRLGLDDLADLEAVVAALAADPDIDAATIGVMAFSFGSAPALIGLSRPPLRDQIRYAVIFGGYFDLRRTFKYVLTGAYDACGHQGRLPLPQHGDDRWKFLHGNLQMLPPSPTSARFAAIAAARVADPDAPADIDGCSDAERAAFALIANRDPDRFDTLYAATGPEVDGWVQRLSPVHTAGGITARLFLVHSYTDQKCPFVESVAMSRAVSTAPPPFLALLDTFAHVDLRLNWRSIPSLVRVGLPGLLSVWRVVRAVMAEARL